MLLERIANLVNRNIAGSSRARALARRLEGRSLTVAVTVPVAMNARARVEQGALHLALNCEQPADVTVCATPLALLPLLGRNAKAHLHSGAVVVTGDAEIAETFQELLRAAGPELEEELSRVFGDAAARQLGNALRSFTELARRAASTFADNLAEFLQEESRDLVSRTEAQEFVAGVDQLREAVDRLEARLRILGRAARRQP